jgi:hypothetical protein
MSSEGFDCKGRRQTLRANDCLPAWCWQVARYGRLRDAETEHQKLAMDPWRTPEKILTGHPCDQMVDLSGNPWTLTWPVTSDLAIDIPKSWTSHYGASARLFPAGTPMGKTRPFRA